MSGEKMWSHEIVAGYLLMDGMFGRWPLDIDGREKRKGVSR